MRRLHSVALLVLALSGCSALSRVPTKEGCQVVDAVHKACVLLRFIDPETGRETEVSLTPEEASRFGASIAAAKRGK